MATENRPVFSDSLFNSCCHVGVRSISFSFRLVAKKMEENSEVDKFWVLHVVMLFLLFLVVKKHGLSRLNGTSGFGRFLYLGGFVFERKPAKLNTNLPSVS